MKFKFWLLLNLTLAVSNVIAQTPKTLLYEISGNNLKSTSYLFGTIHMICANDFLLSDSTQKAIKDAKNVVFEVDINQPNLMFKMFSLMKMKGDTTLKSLFSDGDYQEVKRYLSDSVHLPAMVYNKAKPILLEALILPKIMHCDVKEYEMEINTLAKQQKKDISGLESLEFQLNVIDNIPYKLQSESLLKTIKNKSKTVGEFKTLVNLYKNKDLDGILNLENADSTDITFKFQSQLLNDRNSNWMPIFIQKMQNNSTFFAVGAAHLPGNKGLLQLLTDAGYKIRPIFD